MIGKNGKSISLSADFPENSEKGKAPGLYWSSTKDPSSSNCCFGLLFGQEYNQVICKVDRTCGIDKDNKERSVILCKNRK